MTIVLKLSDKFPSVVIKDFPKRIIPTYTKVFNFVAANPTNQYNK